MILESIFRGNLSAVDLVCPTDPEYKQLSQEVVDLNDHLSNILSPEGKAILDQMIGKIYSAQLLETETYFTFGFAAGAEMQREILRHIQVLKE